MTTDMPQSTTEAEGTPLQEAHSRSASALKEECDDAGGTYGTPKIWIGW
ncbi:hypothetical protein [Streptomyces mirabilis]